MPVSGAGVGRLRYSHSAGCTIIVRSGRCN